LKIKANIFKLEQSDILNRRGTKRISVSPVPFTIFNSTVSKVDASLVSYFESKLNISTEGVIASSDAVLSPVFYIDSDYPGVLEIRQDALLIRENLNITTDLCFAKAVNSTWTC